MSALAARMKRSPRLPRKRLTPLQEAQMEQAERLYQRAEILERGVATALVTGINLSVAISVLREAESLRNEGRRLRSEADSTPNGRGKYA